MTAHLRLRELPAVHELIESLPSDSRDFPQSLLTTEARRVIDRERTRVLRGETTQRDLIAELAQSLNAWKRPSLRPVINATGVVLHTNLGRAPLGHFPAISGYSNLEYDLSTGRRGNRDVHTGKLLRTLLGCPAVLVNNGAAALFLALNELAAGGEAVVSRGELIEIGDGFRIPEIMARSGAVLREVGTTNRTTIEDYRAAINERTRLLLRVHPSNFRITGFTGRPTLAELTELGKETEIPVLEDLGSGCIVDLRPFGIDEPRARESVAAGVDLLTFSGDKLLGGSQAGIVAGREDLVARVRRNPLFRALRQDKLVHQCMEEKLRAILLERWEQVPAIRMIRMAPEEIRLRAEGVLSRITGPLRSVATIEKGESVIGGGSTPDRALATYLIAIGGGSAQRIEEKLRRSDPPVIARIERDRVVLDLRTVFEDEEEALAQALSW